jgi:hypothetical protein
MIRWRVPFVFPRENDPESRRVALELLLTDARSGNSSAAYAAARLLGRFSADTTVSDWALVYAAASGEALKSLAPLEATSLAETGLVRATGRDRVRLYAICHEAAYLAADREMMSRYYRRIVREGDASDVAEARYPVGPKLLRRRAVCRRPVNGSAHTLQPSGNRGLLRVVRGYAPVQGFPVSSWSPFAPAGDSKTGPLHRSIGRTRGGHPWPYAAPIDDNRP